ncbi:MAG: hypothetical protein WBF67_10935 [Olleya sp.]
MKKNLDFCTLTFGDQYVISTIDEGVIFSLDKAYETFLIILEHFKDKPFVYIGNRKNSYSIDPLIYKETSKVNSLKGIAIVSESLIALKSIEIEKLFLQKPFEGFDNMEDAKQWVNMIINQKLA